MTRNERITKNERPKEAKTALIFGVGAGFVNSFACLCRNEPRIKVLVIVDARSA
jgi:hypothetical protein